MQYENEIEHQSELGKLGENLLYRNKMMNSNKISAIAYFGFAGISWTYFPYLALHIGSNLTTLGITGASIMAMLKLN